MRDVKRMMEKAREHTVTELSYDVFHVLSGESGKAYRVELYADAEGATCTCDWGKYRKASDPRSACSHVLAVYDYMAREADHKLSAWDSELDAMAQDADRMAYIGDGVWVTSRRIAIERVAAEKIAAYGNASKPRRAGA